MGLHMRYWYLSHVSKASFEHLMYEGLNGGGGGGGKGVWYSQFIKILAYYSFH